MDKTIYLDNAATSLPKAPGVGTAMADYLEPVSYTHLTLPTIA